VDVELTITTQHLKIQYRQAGSGEIPLVFLHGNYASSRWWLPQLERLPENTRGYAPDLRGCGSSTGITQIQGGKTKPLTIQNLANDLAEFITELHIKNPILIGHSLGGVIATEFALRYPGALRGLILEDSGPPAGTPGGPLTQSILMPLELGSEVLMRNALRLAGIPRRGSFAKALVEDALAALPGQYLAFSRAVSRWNVEATLSTLAIPITLVWGRKDRIMPPSIGHQYLRRIPQAEMLLVPDAGHSPHLERPNAFASVVRQFVEKCVSESETSYKKIPRKNLIDSIARWIRSSFINS
jgi:branched-chain amino acid transport system permease protein